MFRSSFQSLGHHLSTQNSLTVLLRILWVSRSGILIRGHAAIDLSFGLQFTEAVEHFTLYVWGGSSSAVQELTLKFSVTQYVWIAVAFVF